MQGGGALALASKENPVIGSTVIHAPNVASEAMLAGDAIRHYLDQSAVRNKAWGQHVEARADTASMVPATLKDLLKAQDSTAAALEKATDLAGKASDVAQTAKTEAETLYNAKMDSLSQAWLCSGREF